MPDTTIASKLATLVEIKNELRESINMILGTDIDESTPFSDFAKKAEFKKIQSMFEPSDTAALFDPLASALYADAAGTTAAVTGGPVGLRLDVARGVMALGPELVTNGGFDSSSGWVLSATAPATVTITEGVLQIFSHAGEPATVTQNIVTKTVGKTYIISVEFDRPTTGIAQIGNAASEMFIPSGTSGTVTKIIRAADTSALYIKRMGACDVRINSISLREVLGSHASQGTTANCPILRETDLTNRKWLEAPNATDALNMTFASAPGTMYVGRGTAEGVEWSTETWGTTVNTVRQGRYNSWMIARSREFTANEKAMVEGYYRRVLPALGAELVVNGHFTDNINGWLANNAAVLSHESGKIGVLRTVASTDCAYQTLPVVSGDQFLFKVDAPTELALLSVSLASIIISSAVVTAAGSGAMAARQWPADVCHVVLRGATSKPLYDNVSVRKIL